MTRKPWKVRVVQNVLFKEVRPIIWAAFVDRYDAREFAELLRTRNPTWTVTVDAQFPEVDR